MQCTISCREPNILQEADVGDLFLAHTVDLAECVCARTYSPNDQVQVVVIACRVPDGEGCHQVRGQQFNLHPDTPITFLQQVEPFAFRERVPPDPIDATLDALELGKVPTGRVTYRPDFHAEPFRPADIKVETTFGVDLPESVIDKAFRKARDELREYIDKTAADAVAIIAAAYGTKASPAPSATSDPPSRL